MSGPFQQFVILVRHFVKRFIYSDIIKSESHRREMVLILTVVLIGIGGYISYEAVSRLTHIDAAQYAWMAKTYFTTLMMVLAGIVSLITWDKVLLDRKDLNNLLPLPVKTGTLVAAKFFSTFAFVVLVTIAFDLLSSTRIPWKPTGCSK
ncbi:MAG: hypothetical protein GTN68_13455 [Candidatus Aminicenantes bacterium]|nr:hypothetical protein [Candidatus Aminicenantes bacterium]